MYYDGRQLAWRLSFALLLLLWTPDATSAQEINWGIQPSSSASGYLGPCGHDGVENIYYGSPNDVRDNNTATYYGIYTSNYDVGCIGLIDYSAQVSFSQAATINRVELVHNVYLSVWNGFGLPWIDWYVDLYSGGWFTVMSRAERGFQSADKIDTASGPWSNITGIRIRVLGGSTDWSDTLQHLTRELRAWGVPSISPPSSPTGLSASCPAPGTSATVSWNPVSGATGYALRLNNLADGWDGSCTSPAGDSCPGPTSPSYSLGTNPGSSWGWWVHACNTAGCSGATGGPTFTCTPPPPTVSITANPNPIAYNTPSTLTWTMGGGPASSCTASGGGAKSIGGSESTGNLVSSQTYTITCNGPGGTSAPSSVTVNVGASPPPSADIKVNNSDGPIPISSGASVNATWCGLAPGAACANATNCTVTFSDAGGSWSGTSGNQTHNLYATRTYTLACTGPGGSRSDTATVNVSAPTLSVSLSANPSSGPAPLNTTLTADVTSYSGNPADTINYSFWWNCNDPGTDVATVRQPGVCNDPTNPTYGYKVDGVLADPQSTSQHTYAAVGTYTAKVIVERDGANPREARIPITVNWPPITGGSCSASPTPAIINQLVIWAASSPSGGTGSYEFVWHSTDTGGSPVEGRPGNPVQVSYPTSGTKNANVDISSGAQTVNRICTTVTVDAGIISFVASPATISQGQSTTLFISTGGFDSCTINGGSGTGAPNPRAVNPNGTDQRVVRPTQTTTYELLCQPGDVRLTTTVNVRSVPGFIEVPPIP